MWLLSIQVSQWVHLSNGKAVLLWEDRATNNWEMGGRPLSSCLFNIAVTWYLRYTLRFMWHYSHTWVIMMVVDVLVPIWHQDISNHYDDIGHTMYIRSNPLWWDQDDVIKWKHFPPYWHFVRGIHRSLVNSPHKGQWHGAMMFSLIYAWINGWVNNH